MKTRIFYWTRPLGLAVLLIFAAFPLFMLAPAAQGTVEVHYADRTFAAHQSTVYCVAWAPNSTEVVSGGDDGSARIWKWNTTIERSSYEDTDNAVRSVDWSPDRSKIATGWADGRLRILVANTGLNDRTIPHDPGEDNFIYDVSWHPTADRIVTACSSDNTARVWNALDGTEVAFFTNHNDDVKSVEYSPDGSKVASSGNDNKIRIWNPVGGSEIRMISGHYMTVNSVAWSPDGSKIVSGSDDNTARIWDASTGTELLQFTGHTDGVLSVDWSPDGTKIVSGSTDETIKIWDSDTGYEYVNFTGHNGPVRCVDWSRDGDKIAAASTDTRATIWELIAPPSAPKLYFPEDEVLRGETITVQGEAEAYFTPAEDLTADFEYKYYSDAEWTSEGLTSPVFDDGKWQVDFTPGLDCPTGSYGFRVRFQEVNELYSVWTETAGGVTVLNNVPSVQISSAPFTVFRVQQASVAVTVSDLESDPESMSITPQYSEAVVEKWESDIFSSPYYNHTRKFWICNLTFSTGHALTDYKIRIKAQDPDGGYSSWSVVDASIRLLNNPPRVTNLSFSPPEVYRGRDNPVTIWIDVEDPEDASKILVPEVEIRSPKSDWIPLSVNNNPRGSNFTAFYNTTAVNELGYYDLRIFLEDVDGGEGVYYYNRSLTVMNNLPDVTGDHVEIGLYNDRIDYFDLTEYATDLEDGADGLIWAIIESNSPQFSAVMSDPTTLSVEPSLDGGEGKGLLIKFKVTDRDGGVSYKDIYVEIRDASECPDIEVSLISPANGIIVGGTSVDLSWDIDYTLGAPIYSVYMGESEDNLILVHTSEMVNTLTHPGLYDGITYYWKVTARLHDIPRTFETPIWYFTVDKDYTIKHNVSFTFDKSIVEDINPRDVVTLELTISNHGNVMEEVVLTVVGRFEGKVYMEVDGKVEYNVKNLILCVEDGKKLEIPVSINWSKSWGDSTLTITLKYADDEEITEKVRLEVAGSGTTPGDSGSTSPIVWIILVIVILGGLGGAYFIWRSKNRRDREEDQLEPSPFLMPPPPPIPEGPPGRPHEGSHIPPHAPHRPPMFFHEEEEQGFEEPEPMGTDEIQAEIIQTIELLKTLEGHRSSLEESLIWVEEASEKQVIKTKIVAITQQQSELQQKAVILGEKAKSMVKVKEDAELDEIFGKREEPAIEEPVEEVKVLPARTIPVSEQKALPEAEVEESVEEKVEEPMEAKVGEPFAEKAEELEEAKVEAADVSSSAETDVSPEDGESAIFETLSNEIMNLVGEAKEMGQDVTSPEEKIGRARASFNEENIEAAMAQANDARKELEDIVSKGLRETLVGKIKKLSSDIGSAKEKKIPVEDESDALSVINRLTESGKYREAISTLGGIQSAIDGKLLHYNREIRTERIAEAKIELEGLELEGAGNIDELRSHIETAVESVDIDDIEATDDALKRFEDAKSAAIPSEVPVTPTQPTEIPSPVPEVTRAVPETVEEGPTQVPTEIVSVEQAAPDIAPAAVPPKPRAPPKKRIIKRRIRKGTPKVVKRKVKKVKKT